MHDRVELSSGKAFVFIKRIPSLVQHAARSKRTISLSVMNWRTEV